MVRFAEFMSDNEIEESLSATLGGDRGSWKNVTIVGHI